ncbi:hypothetical protein, partial [Streptomyces rubellomurinus]
RVFLPFEWTGVELFAAGGTELRVRVDLDASGTIARIWVADPAGGPVAYVDGLQIREASAEQVRAGATVDHLYRVSYQETRVLEERSRADLWILGEGTGAGAALLAGLPTARLVDGVAALIGRLAAEAHPSAVAVDLTGSAGPVHEALSTGLALTQQLVAEPALESVELVFVTRGAVAGDPVQAALWGLLRTARTEYP